MGVHRMTLRTRRLMEQSCLSWRRSWYWRQPLGCTLHTTLLSRLIACSRPIASAPAATSRFLSPCARPPSTHTLDSVERGHSQILWRKGLGTDAELRQRLHCRLALDCHVADAAAHHHGRAHYACQVPTCQSRPKIPRNCMTANDCCSMQHASPALQATHFRWCHRVAGGEVGTTEGSRTNAGGRLCAARQRQTRVPMCRLPSRRCLEACRLPSRR